VTDRAGILALLARYTRCADRLPAAPPWSDCFAERAVLRSFSPRRDRPPAVLMGCAVIAEAFVSATPSHITTHVVANVVVEYDPHGAEVRSTFVRFDHLNETTVAVGSFGEYLDRAVLCADGLWRLSEREIHLVSRRRPTPAA
jgi:hypothetical protein